MLKHYTFPGIAPCQDIVGALGNIEPLRCLKATLHDMSQTFVCYPSSSVHSWCRVDGDPAVNGAVAGNDTIGCLAGFARVRVCEQKFHHRHVSTGGAQSSAYLLMLVSARMLSQEVAKSKPPW